MEAAWIIAALIIPFILVRRWQGNGFIVAVLLGWALIHASNMTAEVNEPVDAVFAGLWALLGWAYMAAWCSIVWCVVSAGLWIMRKLWLPTAS